jgi:DNA-binding response OmpR family regulator
VKQQIPVLQSEFAPVIQLDLPGQEPRGNCQSVIRFGRFCLLPDARKLLADGTPLELGSRAFDLLVALIESRGTLLSKKELMDRVWPNTLVEEHNLRVQVSALRRVLGGDGDLIKNIPGRGYVFAVDVTSGLTALAVARTEPAISRQASRPRHLPSYHPISRQRPIGSKMSAFGQASPVIAVIDDDQDIRDAIQDLLQSAGLCAELFASVADFRKEFRAESYACLVLDVQLPGQSGLDFYDELLETDHKLPVVFVSGHADVPMSVRAMKAGAIDFLTKPVSHQDLLDAIRRAIKSHP